jgi:hypothetical protein
MSDAMHAFRAATHAMHEQFEQGLKAARPDAAVIVSLPQAGSSARFRALLPAMSNRHHISRPVSSA